MNGRLLAASAIVVAACGTSVASADNNETPITWDRGHIEMSFDAPGQSVVFFTMHGHDCIVVGDTTGVEGGVAPALALSCNWSPK